MKKGFTLIELLAVIVILAIIALIATPIVLNIINDTKQSAALRSADFYLHAVELAIANSTLKNQSIPSGTYEIKDGDICLNPECTDKLEVEVNGEVPKTGEITINRGNVESLNIIIEEKEITKNSKGEMVYVKTLNEVCKYISGTEKTAGAKYECKVDPNKEPYTFYVLTTPKETDTTINLIMDSNINSDGTPVTRTIYQYEAEENNGIYNTLPWINYDDFISVGGELLPPSCFDCGFIVQNNAGPITAMNFLKEATKTWTNTNEMTVDTFLDETGIRYDMAKSYITYARLPIYASDASITEVADKTDANAYLYDNLDLVLDEYESGYWTFSASSRSDSGAYIVLGSWKIIVANGVDWDYFDNVGSNYGLGVRPVITLKLETNK